MSKVKANDKFRFPLELDLSANLPPEAQDDAVYDLSAILIHKGSSASHGHYGANIAPRALLKCTLLRQQEYGLLTLRGNAVGVVSDSVGCALKAHWKRQVYRVSPPVGTARTRADLLLYRGSYIRISSPDANHVLCDTCSGAREERGDAGVVALRRRDDVADEARPRGRGRRSRRAGHGHCTWQGATRCNVLTARMTQQCTSNSAYHNHSDH